MARYSSLLKPPSFGQLTPPSPTTMQSHAPQERSWGSLHGKPCTLAEFLELSFDFGKYDLVQGKLIAREMPDAHHDDTSNAFKEACDLEAKEGEVTMVDASIATIGSLSSSSAPGNGVRTPDFSIGPKLSQEEEENLPSDYRRITWTSKNRARLVGEITSFNASTDFDEKAKEYAEAGVSRYMIVDRDKRNAGTDEHKPAVHYGRLEGKSYNFTTYEKGSNEKVGSPGPLHHTADVLLDPKKLRAITERKKKQRELQHQQEQKKRKEAEERERREKEERKKAEKRERREKEERKKAEERERREKEERKKAEERERREKEERKKAEERERREKEERKKAEERERREKEERKKAEKERKKAEERARTERRKRRSMKERLRKIGEPVSDSSSECNSPPRKRR
ncbi:protein split ends [Gracilaria domingensis]|nr:protein split ends [Gracilaria domingensis]